MLRGSPAARLPKLIALLSAEEKAAAGYQGRMLGYGSPASTGKAAVGPASNEFKAEARLCFTVAVLLWSLACTH